MKGDDIVEHVQDVTEMLKMVAERIGVEGTARFESDEVDALMRLTGVTPKQRSEADFGVRLLDSLRLTEGDGQVAGWLSEHYEEDELPTLLVARVRVLSRRIADDLTDLAGAMNSGDMGRVDLLNALRKMAQDIDPRKS